MTSVIKLTGSRCAEQGFLSAWVRVTFAMMKLNGQEQLGEESIYLANTSNL